jgi:hypothetical protein
VNFECVGTSFHGIKHTIGLHVEIVLGGNPCCCCYYPRVRLVLSPLHFSYIHLAKIKDRDKFVVMVRIVFVVGARLPAIIHNP